MFPSQSLRSALYDGPSHNLWTTLPPHRLDLLRPRLQPIRLRSALSVGAKHYPKPHRQRGQVAQILAGDCSTLAVWTPANATANSKLPVIHFLTGGGDIPTQLPPNCHYSDLYMFFGTHADVAAARAMQGFLLDFVKDPTSLPGKGVAGV
ncbi:hypothetical protein HMN09_01328800 [Mycena chlorophos]|uniref:Carboxylesterase type B domain-containing protein n=1 Tax=Mycena chlorophos TaxID=658473 RepID=A0A8H6S0I3_MYCCL|nr:hypothetical protein HMN09_01328800 [Mycena chlorophos]